MQIKSAGQTIVIDNSNLYKIQVKADEIVYDPKTFTTHLKGKTTVTIREGWTKTTHLSDREATITGGQIELQVNAGSSIQVDHNAPIRELSKALQPQNPSMNYRVKWYFSVFQYYSDGTALYDRKNGTLSEYIREGDEDRGWIYHRYYCGVTDEILLKMAEDAEGAKDETQPFDFRDLTRYGCTVVEVR